MTLFPKIAIPLLFLGLAACAGPPMSDQAPASLETSSSEQNNYIVFFDFDKSDLMLDSRRVIASAAHVWARNPEVKVVIAGYADTPGTAEYNFNLSFHRASVVEEELIVNGVAAEAISIKSEHDLLMPTRDGVRELQNRRATIELIDP